MRAQKGISQLQIIVIDSGSSDDSREIATQYEAHVIEVAAADFNHGSTRNLGIKYISSELVYYTVQDAFLAEDTMLAKMAAHFEDTAVTAVCGMQAVPHDRDKNPALWFKRASSPDVKKLHYSEDQWANLSPELQFIATAWDNVNAMYRREALVEIPFAAIHFGEDRLWALAALQAGKVIAYDPGILAWHYHHTTRKYALKRNAVTDDLHYLYFSKKPSFPDFRNQLLARLLYIIRNDKLAAADKIKWIAHNIWSYSIDVYSFLSFHVFFWRRGAEGIRNRFFDGSHAVPIGTIKNSKSFIKYKSEETQPLSVD